MAGVRQAGPGDAAAIGAIEVETWRATYAGTLADSTLVGMSAERSARRWAGDLRRGGHGLWVWQDDRSGVLGFGHCGRQREPALACDGEITMLYVLPDAQGQGIGRDLMRAMFADLAGHGVGSALVWVLRDNPARFFYGHLGGRLALHRRITVGGRPVEVLGYVWSPLIGAVSPGSLAGRHPI